ncbi:MAG TPA: VOC family protein [Armatimonadota bacterium]|jgi:catechol 2,3-dioxygenase-like lactoylglutathione lyase family enzyme
MATEFRHLVLEVEDVQRSIHFYRDIVGLRLTAQEERERHHIAVLSLGDFELMLLQQPQTEEYGLGRRGGGMLLQFQVQGVEGLYKTFRENGVTIACDLGTSSWGERAFVGVDPDGYRLMLAEPVSGIGR